MKILISGGGIAGTSLAFWLSKLGHHVTVVERFPTLRATGLQIDLRGHGIEVMKRMGLEPKFRHMSVPEQGLQIVNKSGKRRAYFPANTSGKGKQNFTTDYEIMRGDLCRLIYDASTKHGAKYIFGTVIEKFEERNGQVEVHFADGRTDKFDLLVGADGVRSSIRKTLLGPDVQDAFYPLPGGVYTGYFTTPQPIKKGEEYLATLYMSPGNRGIMTRRHDEHNIQVYIGCTSNSDKLRDARGDVKKQKDAFKDIFRGAGWRTDDLIKALENSTDFYCEHMGLVRLDSWSRGRVVLVGDAAYCPTANTGMGTTSAIVGAYVLAGEIGKADGEKDFRMALEVYENKFRPFMDKVQKGVEKGGMSTPSSSIGIAAFNLFMGVASLLHINIGAWLLKETVKGWSLPEYGEMGKF